MPRVFLVKKTSSTSGKKNWNEVPDCVRGDIYTPGECYRRRGRGKKGGGGVRKLLKLYLNVCGFVHKVKITMQTIFDGFMFINS